MQFHPEFTVDDIADVIRNAAEPLSVAGIEPSAMIEAIRPAEDAALLITQFRALSEEELVT